MFSADSSRSGLPQSKFPATSSSQQMDGSHVTERANASPRGPGRGQPGWSTEGPTVPCCLWPTRSCGVFMVSRETGTLGALWLEWGCSNSCTIPPLALVTFTWEVGEGQLHSHLFWKWDARMLRDHTQEFHTPGIPCTFQTIMAPVTCHVWKTTGDSCESVPLSKPV